ncbi:ROK family protein [bacterium]|nr:ROK family protein [bacterium]
MALVCSANKARIQGVVNVALDGKHLVIGVDGGGTKTEAALVHKERGILAEGLFPSTNIHSNPHDQVREALRAIVHDLAAKAGVPVDAIDGMCLGMAGADRPADKTVLTEMLNPHVAPTTKILIVNDAVVAMEAVLKRLHGILLIAGTGSICLGYREEQTVRCGGWGHFLADEGSGYMLGLSALRAIMENHDQRMPDTTLTKRILGELKLNSPTDLVGWIYLGKNGKTEVAALSRIVHDEGTAGDPVARQILDREAGRLVEIVEPVYRRLFGATGESTELALWGGNLLNAALYQSLFLKKLEATGLPVKPVIDLKARAVLGAATHAFNMLG